LGEAPEARIWEIRPPSGLSAYGLEAAGWIWDNALREDTGYASRRRGTGEGIRKKEEE